MSKTFSDTIADIAAQDIRTMTIFCSDGSQRDGAGDLIPAGTPLEIHVDFAVRRQGDNVVLRRNVPVHASYAALPNPVKADANAFLARGPAIAQNRLDAAARLDDIA